MKLRLSWEYRANSIDGEWTRCNSALRLSGMWRCVVGWVVPDVSKGLVIVAPKNEGDTFLRNVEKHSPEGALSHPRRLEFSESWTFFFIYSYLLGNSNEGWRNGRDIECIGMKGNIWTVLTYLHLNFLQVIQTLLLCGTGVPRVEESVQRPGQAVWPRVYKLHSLYVFIIDRRNL